MVSFMYMEPLLVRFTKAQRAKIRRGGKKLPSEAEFVRRAVDAYQI